MIPIDSIHLNKDNPRTIDDKMLEKLKSSIQDFKEMMELRPIIVDEHNIVIGGNMRLTALKELGYKELPDNWIKVATGLTDEQKKEFVIKDNSNFGNWDYRKLLTDWNITDLADWGLNKDTLSTWNDALKEVDDDDFKPEPDLNTKIKVGDIIEIGNDHRLFCGDAMKPESFKILMNGNKADLIVTDPPYNVDYTGGTKDKLKIQNDHFKSADAFYNFLLDSFRNAVAHTKKGGAWYVWHADTEGVNFRLAFQNAGLKLAQNLIWIKNNSVMGRQDYHWKHEPCLYGWLEGDAHYFAKKTPNTIIRDDELKDIRKMKKPELIAYIEEKLNELQDSTIRIQSPHRSELHPTMKPVSLFALLFNNSSQQGESVLDFFAGSGTTIITGIKTNRKTYSMELDPIYCQVIIDRVKNSYPDMPIKINGILQVNKNKD